jgi:hypothetical protein
MSVTKGQRNKWRARREVFQAGQLKLNRRQYAFHLEQYTYTMIAMRRDATTPEQQAEIERLYFAATGKSLRAVLEQRIIMALEG